MTRSAQLLSFRNRARHSACGNNKMTTGATPSSTGKGRFEGWERPVIPRVLVCLVTIALAMRISAAPADAANVPATPSDGFSPLTGAGVGDVAPFSLETSGAGSDYTGPYIPNLPLSRPPSAQTPAQPSSLPNLSPP